MAYIYKITNNINGKIYIGKTEFSVEERFKQHCYDSKRKRDEKRPLYDAMNKYGIENFSIETIEETDEPEEREAYWIEYFGSFKNGYNATLGGDGRRYIDYDLVVASYKELNNLTHVANKLEISVDSVREILRIKQIQTLSSPEICKNVYGKLVNQYSLNGEYIKTFGSVGEACIKITGKKDGKTHISDVCKGKRKTAYGYIWKFAE